MEQRILDEPRVRALAARRHRLVPVHHLHVADERGGGVVHLQPRGAVEGSLHRQLGEVGGGGDVVAPGRAGGRGGEQQREQ